MNNYPIFYIINGQYYENSDLDFRKLKKVTFIFENDNSKSLRYRALKKFNEIKNTILIKNEASAPTYKVINNVGKNTCIDAIENVLFYTDKIELSLALTLSYGIKESSGIYSSLDSNDYPYNKNLYPISAIGRSLHHIENTLKINLILEKQLYKTYKQEFPKYDKIKNFINVDILKDYILSNPHGVQEIGILCNTLKDEFVEIFSTDQFYSYLIPKIPEVNQEATFLELYKYNFNKSRVQKASVFREELNKFRAFYKILYGNDANFNLSDTSHVSRNLRKRTLEPFFTQNQLSIYDEMKELNNQYSKDFVKEKNI